MDIPFDFRHKLTYTLRWCVGDSYVNTVYAYWIRTSVLNQRHHDT